MHGRLKVKTTAQQDAERKVQRQEKLKTYEAAMAAIFHHRKLLSESAPSSDVDRESMIKTQLKMTAGVLMANPDISTLWNIRKQMLDEILVKMEDEKVHDKTLTGETDLTVQCLQSNPKSYGAWHHRCWSLLRMKYPNWEHELMLCNKYLTLDERNFHCWDYRRFVIKHADITPEHELNYSMERINVNFSNYSAWHYRSKLLPVIEGGKISESTRRDELDKVLQAAFTDPEDSSAWFYHKWLLGRPDDLMEPVIATHENDQLLVAFSRAVESSDFQLFVDEILHESADWKSSGGQKFDTLWSVDCPTTRSSMRLQLANGQSIELNKNGTYKRKYGENHSIDPDTFSVFEQELQHCNDLLEYEPDSKWTLYTKMLIMKTMNAEKFHDEIIRVLDALCSIDAKRKGYYKDLRSKCIVERALASDIHDEVNLANKGLTCVYFKERFAFVRKINLSANGLSCVNSFLPYLKRCEELILDENMIRTINYDSLGNLKILSLKSNPICDNVDDIAKLKSIVKQVVV